MPGGAVRARCKPPPALLQRHEGPPARHAGRPRAMRRLRRPSTDGAAHFRVARGLQEGSFAEFQDFARDAGTPSRVFFSISVVEYPGTPGTDTTRPPAASTSSRPTIWSAGQSPPLTRTSGSRAARTRCGVKSAKITTASTHSSAARISARSRSGISGRRSPLRCLTLASLFKPTINASPRLRACSRLRMWPGWSKSKQPLVNTTRRPLRFPRPNRRIACSSVKMESKRVYVRAQPKQIVKLEPLVYHARVLRPAAQGAGSGVICGERGNMRQIKLQTLQPQRLRLKLFQLRRDLARRSQCQT